MNEQTVFADQVPDAHFATGGRRRIDPEVRHFLAGLDGVGEGSEAGSTMLSLDADAGTAKDWDLLEEHHTAWYDEYESAVPWTASKVELMALARSAPTCFARGVVLGWLLARHDVAAQSGVPFL